MNIKLYGIALLASSTAFAQPVNIRGVVTEAGRPVDIAWVEWAGGNWFTGIERGLVYTTHHTDGAYEIRWLRPGRYYIRAGKRHTHIPTSYEIVDVPPDGRTQTRNLTVAPARWSLRAIGARHYPEFPNFPVEEVIPHRVNDRNGGHDVTANLRLSRARGPQADVAFYMGAIYYLPAGNAAAERPLFSIDPRMPQDTGIFGINNHAQAIGFIRRNQVAHPAFADLPEARLAIGPRFGSAAGVRGQALAINELGYIVGEISAPLQMIDPVTGVLTSIPATQAAIYYPSDRPGGDRWYTLGTLGGNESHATAINRSGTIVGQSATSLGPARSNHAFLFESLLMTDLGTLGGDNSEATGINDTGWIVGTAQRAGGEKRAVYWNPFFRGIHELGTPLDWIDSSFRPIGDSNAQDISANGDVVGSVHLYHRPSLRWVYRPILWDRYGFAPELNSFKPNTNTWLDWRLETATGISPSGQAIVGTMRLTGPGDRAEAWPRSQTGFLMKPPAAGNLPPRGQMRINGQEEPLVRVAVGEAVYFDADASIDEDGTITRFTWDFGDANVSNEPISTNVYKNPGTYIVVLTVEDDRGDFHSVPAVVQVQAADGKNSPPAIAPDFDCVRCHRTELEGPYAGEQIVLHANPNDDDLSQVNFQWETVSGPGKLIFSSPTDADTGAHCDVAGIYVIRLTAKDGEYEISQDVTIEFKPQKVKIKNERE